MSGINPSVGMSDAKMLSLKRVKLAVYFTQVTPRCCGPRRGLPRLFRSQATAPTTEETPALLLGRPSGGLLMQRGRLVSEDHCTPMAPRVCRKPGPQQVGVT